MAGNPDFVKVTEVSEVPTGKMNMFEVSGKEILVANVGGKLYAIGNRCTHMGGDLSQGTLEGRIVTCPRHGSRFDVTTGRAISGPKIVFVRMRTKDEPSFEVKIEGSSILVKTS